MRYIWMIFAGLLVLMVAVLPRLSRPNALPAVAPPTPDTPVALATSRTAAAPNATTAARADSIVAFGLAQRGTPYVWAGTSPLTGFDCSGFIMYTFAHFGVLVPHSTSLLIDVGRPVARAEAQPGDIVVFTGTAPGSTTAGHAGIVISRRGELPLRFVHASSSRREPFVKVSQVESSDYERRFMQVRRVLGPGTGVAAVPRPAADARPTASVAALPARPVAIDAEIPLGAKLPTLLPTRKPKSTTGAQRKVATAHSRTQKPVAAPKPAAVSSKAKFRPTSKVTTKKPLAKKRTGAPVRHK
ncbi:MAG: C40 family peptidase [Bacteroidota bacterium]|nr:C40 family peptidase [Bacteroidota bacterium]